MEYLHYKKVYAEHWLELALGLWNKSSIEFHKRMGFKDEDTLVHFIKEIGQIAL
ncbi:MAG: hypothetical protein ACR2MT_05005 [Aurantibacter sp.]